MNVSATNTEKGLFLFSIGPVTLALSMDAVEHVIPATEITPIPKTARFVLGIAAVRGQIMSVIDGGLRLGISSHKSEYFAVCHVRGNETAVLIDQPLEAKDLHLCSLGQSDYEFLLNRYKLNGKLFNGAWEILEKRSERWLPTGRKILEVNADQFVSDQMASQIVAG